MPGCGGRTICVYRTLTQVARQLLTVYQFFERLHNTRQRVQSGALALYENNELTVRARIETGSGISVSARATRTLDRSAGFDAHLVKPADIAVLEKTLASL
jgi:hypothetical protein